VDIANTHELILPNAFTPSLSADNAGLWIPGDLSNDVFYAFAVDVADFSMIIHNRWGEQIFESSDPAQGWDGTYLGQMCPQDVYMVRTWVRFNDGQQLQKYTDLTLLR
jgi:gliding motility-associated-like protein